MIVNFGEKKMRKNSMGLKKKKTLIITEYKRQIVVK